MELDLKEMGKRIAQRRKHLNMKQNTLSELIGISNNHMSGIENGKAGLSVELLLKICAVLDTTPDYFLLGVLHSSNTPENFAMLLRLCTDKDVETLKTLAQYFVSIREESRRPPE